MRKPVTDLDAENSRLRHESAEAKMERDLLKRPLPFVEYLGNILTRKKAKNNYYGSYVLKIKHPATRAG